MRFAGSSGLLQFSHRLVIAVSPPPEEGCPGANTAEDDNAVLNLTAGSHTAVGSNPMVETTNGFWDTAIGSGALLNNTGRILNAAARFATKR